LSVLSQILKVSPTRYRAIFGTFPNGVSVVTTRDLDGDLNGLTATSVCSLSLEPPLLLVCVSDDSTTLPALRRRRRFVVNFLAGGKSATARRFASDDNDKFVGIAWKPSMEHELPILVDDAAAYAECRTVNEIQAGDHVIIVGLIEDGELMSDRSALVFRGGVYTTWPAEAAVGPDTDTPMLFLTGL
jgi:flavin reductase (DIM6/NTAB) family NADH-FMN oxidoreductase RutF